MAYTFLRVTEAGVVLWEYHLRRLGLPCGSQELAAFLEFGRSAAPGAWSVWAEGSELRLQKRAGSRLTEGMPTRLRPSPIADRKGTQAKEATPGLYDSVRLEGVATLLTSSDGAEIYESCSAAILGWDGQQIVCAPMDRPRVGSTAEAAVREHLMLREAPLNAGAMPLLLINAVKGTCTIEQPGVPPFPAEVRDRIGALFTALTLRPS